MECLPSSTIPDDLRKLGYIIEETGAGERILASAIVEKLVLAPNGELAPLTADSTRPIASTMTHSGIVKVRRPAVTNVCYRGLSGHPRSLVACPLLTLNGRGRCKTNCAACSGSASARPINFCFRNL
jgi:hypothetical protein